jgi:prevent-host-death family protein
MTITASKLRENIYRILDEVAETGVPVEVVRKGVKLRIVPEVKRSKLANLKKRKDIVREGDEFASAWFDGGGEQEWLVEWKDFK